MHWNEMHIPSSNIDIWYTKAIERYNSEGACADGAKCHPRLVDEENNFNEVCWECLMEGEEQ